jgi:hypothetical protein
VCHGQAECMDNAAAKKSGATRAEKLRGGGCGRARYARGAGGGGAACGGGAAEREDGGDAGASQALELRRWSSTFLSLFKRLFHKEVK